MLISLDIHEGSVPLALAVAQEVLPFRVLTFEVEELPLTNRQRLRLFHVFQTRLLLLSDSLSTNSIKPHLVY